MRATNKDNNSALKRLVPAVAMLALSAVTLSTSTYAWFTMNKEVTMTGLNMSATVGESMEIALASVRGATDQTIGLKGDTPGNYEGSHPQDIDTELGWNSAVVVGEYYSEIGKLSPASSADGVNFFDATNAKDRGTVASEFRKLSLTNDMASIKKKDKKSSESTVIAATGTSGYFVDIPVHLRTTKVKYTAANGDEVKTSDVYYKIVIGNNNSDDDTKNSLYKAVRIAFIPSDDDQTSSETRIFTCDGLTEYYSDNGTVGKAVVAEKGDNKSPVNILKNDSVTDGTTITGDFAFPAGEGSDSGLNIALATNAGEYGHLDFIVRVWLEGESKSCFNEKAGQEWDINFAFSMDKFSTSATP